MPSLPFPLLVPISEPPPLFFLRRSAASMVCAKVVPVCGPKSTGHGVTQEQPRLLPNPVGGGTSVRTENKETRRATNCGQGMKSLRGGLVGCPRVGSGGGRAEIRLGADNEDGGQPGARAGGEAIILQAAGTGGANTGPRGKGPSPPPRAQTYSSCWRGWGSLSHELLVPHNNRT